MSDIARVREIGLPAMTNREYKIYCKRQEFIKAGDTKGLAEFDAKLNKKLEQTKTEKVEENKEDSIQ